MTCPDCTESTRQEWHGFSAGCNACKARGLARIFLRKGESGRRLGKACEQAGVTVADVRSAWAVDASNPEAKSSTPGQMATT